MTLPLPTSERSDNSRKRGAVPLICLAQFIVVLDASIVNVALPTIGTALHTDSSGLAWIVDAYVLTFGGLLLLGGRLGDVWGKRRMFVTGVALFTAASLACGLAHGLDMLIAARLVQGVGGALISPTAISLITAMVPPGKPRAAALALYGAMGGLGAMTGEILGGVLTAEASWRWVFGINVPIGLVLLIAAPLVLATPPTVARRLEPVSAATGTATLTAVVYALLRAGDHGWSDQATITAFAAAVIFAVGFIASEHFSDQPIIPVALRRNPATVRACLTYLLVFALAYPAKFLLTRFFQQVLGYGPLRTGLLFLPAGAAIVVGAVVARRVLPRISAPPVAFAGAAAATFCGAWLTRVTPHSTYLVDLLPALIALGLGFGFSAVSNTLLAVENVNPTEMGAAAGLFTTSGQVGGAVGIAAATSIASTVTAHTIVSGRPLTEALAAGFRPAFALAAALALIGAVASLTRGRVGGRIPVGRPT